MLVRNGDEELIETLTYSLREVIRNVVEHSESKIIKFCAQFWPTKGKVELIILDEGIGIKESLSNNPFLQLDSDREAIQLSLMPGVSGKMFKGVRKIKNDVWQNSGFGLYMTSRIAREGGSFFIASGDSGILLEMGGKKDLNLSLDGTLLRLVIKSSSLKSLSSRLERFRKEGYSIASDLDGIGQIESSVASMMLSKNFDKSQF